MMRLLLTLLLLLAGLLDGHSYALDVQGRRTNAVRRIGQTDTAFRYGYDALDQLTGAYGSETNSTPRGMASITDGYEVA